MANQRNIEEFPEHIDNALDKVQGEHIMNIQKSINDNKLDTNILYEKSFLNECTFILQNNPNVNLMFHLDMSNLDDILKSRSSKMKHDNVNKCAYVDVNEDMISIIHSIQWKSNFSDTINGFILKADADIPRGTNIRYFITEDLSNYYPIKPGESIGVNLKTNWKHVYIRVELITNNRKQTPRLFGLALFCKDKVLDGQSSIDKSVIDEIPETNGSVDLFYDDVSGSLDHIITPDGSVIKLNFDANGDLDNVVTRSGPLASTVTTTELVKDEAGILTHVLVNTIVETD